MCQASLERDDEETREVGQQARQQTGHGVVVGHTQAMVLVLAIRLVSHVLATGLVVGLSMRLINRLAMLLFIICPQVWSLDWS